MCVLRNVWCYMADEKRRDDEGEMEESYQVGLSEEISFSLRVGGSYLIKEKKAENGMMVLIRLLRMGMKGLCISGTIPKKIRSRYGLSDSDLEVIWLSGADSGGECCNPNRIDFEIMDRISDFFKSGGRALLLDGLEHIEIANGFDKAVEFVKTLIDFTAVHNGIFILSINPTSFKREQLATLEWQLEPLPILGVGGAESQEGEAPSAAAGVPGKRVEELEKTVTELRTGREKAEEDNRKLAEGIISVSKELENLQEILKLKEEEILMLRKQVYDLNAELRKSRLYGAPGGRPGAYAGYPAGGDERVKNLEEEVKRLGEILSRRDSEIKHLTTILKEKGDALSKKQEMLKSLLSRVTDVEVTISTPQKRHGEGALPPPPPPGYRGPAPYQSTDSRGYAGPQGQQYPPYQQRPFHQATPPSPGAMQRTQDAPPCPACGNIPMKVRGVGDTERLFCERCRKWLK
jgi:uncharacterized coiled-coil protein SlyX